VDHHFLVLSLLGKGHHLAQHTDKHVQHGETCEQHEEVPKNNHVADGPFSDYVCKIGHVIQQNATDKQLEHGINNRAKKIFTVGAAVVVWSPFITLLFNLGLELHRENQTEDIQKDNQQRQRRTHRLGLGHHPLDQGEKFGHRPHQPYHPREPHEPQKTKLGQLPEPRLPPSRTHTKHDNGQ